MADHRELKQDLDELLARVTPEGLVRSGTGQDGDVLCTAMAIPTLAERGQASIVNRLVEALQTRRDAEGGWDEPWTTLLATEAFVGLKLRGIEFAALVPIIDQGVKVLKGYGAMESTDRELRLARVLVLDGLSRKDARRIDSGLIRARAAVEEGLNFDAPKSESLHGLLSLADLYLVTTDSATKELVDRRVQHMQLEDPQQWTEESAEVLARAGVIAEKLQNKELAQQYYDMAAETPLAELESHGLKHRVELGARLYGEMLPKVEAPPVEEARPNVFKPAEEPKEEPEAAVEAETGSEQTTAPQPPPVAETRPAPPQPEKPVQDPQPVKETAPQKASTIPVQEDFSGFPAYQDLPDDYYRGVSVIVLHKGQNRATLNTLDALNRQSILPVDVTVVHRGDFRMDPGAFNRFEMRHLILDKLDTEGDAYNRALALGRGDWVWVLPGGRAPASLTIQAALQEVTDSINAVFIQTDEDQREEILTSLVAESVLSSENVMLRRSLVEEGFEPALRADPLWGLLLSKYASLEWADTKQGPEIGFEGERKDTLRNELNRIHDAYRLNELLEEDDLIKKDRRDKARLNRRVVYEACRRESKPLVSIVIPHYNLPEMLQRCIESIIDNTDAIPFEVIVIDNGSDNTTEELIDQLQQYGILYLRNKRNEGFARAINRGVREARGEFVLLLNNDTEVKPGWMQAMLGAHLETGADIVGARLQFPDGTIQHAGITFDEDSVPSHIYGKGPNELPMVRIRRFFQAVTAACMLVRRDVFLRLGGMDEGFRNGWEDVDFCLRARQMGVKIVYEPNAIIVHYSEQTEGRKNHEDENTHRYLAMWKGRVEPDFERYAVADGFEVVMKDGKRVLEPTEKAQQMLRDQQQREREQASATSAKVEPPEQEEPQEKVKPAEPQKSDAENLSNLLAQADLMIKEGNFEEAEETLKGGAHKVNGNVKRRAMYWTLLGDARFRLERTDEALDCYKKAVDDDPSAQRAWVGIATYHLVTNDLDRAEDIFSKVVELAPEFDRGYMGLGNVLLRRKQYDGALDNFLKASRLAPDHRPAIVGMVAAALQANRLQDARSPIEHYLKAHPDDIETRFHFAAILFSEKDVHNARTQAEKVLELNPNHSGAKQMLTHLGALT